MSLTHKLKKLFKKDNFNFARNDIDLDTFHPQLRLLILPMGIFFSDMDYKLRFVLPLLNTMLILVGLGILLMLVYHGVAVKDFSFATECFCYFVILGIAPSVYATMLINKKHVLIILNEMNKDFLEICKLKSYHRKYFLDKQLLIWKLCISWLVAMVIIVIVYMSTAVLPLIYLSLFGNQDEHYTRPLIFPLWLPEDDPYRTPNYEVFLSLEVWILIIFLQTFLVFVYIEFHVLLHVCIKLDLIALDLKAIFEGLDASTATLPRHDERRVATHRALKDRIQRIVCWHVSTIKFIASISIMIGTPFVYQILFSSVAVCLIMYQIAVGFAVGEACWNCGWQESPLAQLLRQDILIVILRAQQPLTIKFTGLPQLSLETYSSMMSTAYSYFNMLRQYNRES